MDPTDDTWFSEIVNDNTEQLNAQNEQSLYTDRQGEDEVNHGGNVSCSNSNYTQGYDRPHHISSLCNSDVLTKIISDNKEMKLEMEKITSRLNLVEEELDDHNDHILFLEKQMAKLEQYGRRTYFSHHICN